MKLNRVEPKFTHKECTVSITFSPVVQDVLDLLADLRRIEEKHKRKLAEIILKEATD